MGLCAISLPDPKNVLPQWLSETQALFYNSWSHGWKKGTGAKRFLSATFKVSDMHDILDLNNMTGVSFMKTAIEWLNKQRVEKNMVQGYITGYTNADGKQRNFYINYRFEGEDLEVDGTDIDYHNCGRNRG